MSKELEQFMFHQSCLTTLADLAEEYENPCCLCTPSVGRELARRGRTVRVFDVDDRFSDIPGFRRYDVYAPVDPDETFDIIISDMPFLGLGASRMFDVIERISAGNRDQRMLVTFPSARGTELVETFASYRLTATGYRPPYEADANQTFVEFFGNLGEERHRRLFDTFRT